MRIFNTEVQLRLWHPLAVWGAILLSGCALPSPSFSDMSQKYQAEVELFQNNNILLNIVRASQGMPLAFLDIPSVLGTGAMSETVGLYSLNYSVSGQGVSSFFTPTGGSYYSPSLSLTANRSFNFTLSSLQNAQFQKGFLSKIPLDVLNYFMSENYSKELIYTLLIERFEYLDLKGVRHVLVNNPADSPENYARFQRELNMMIVSGLSTEQVLKVQALSPLLSAQQITENNAIIQYVGLRDKNINLDKVVKDKKIYYQLNKPESEVRFCFKKNQYTADVVKYFSKAVICHDSLQAKGKDEKLHNTGLTMTDEPGENGRFLSITLRSTQDVFEYLGKVIAVQNERKQTIKLYGDGPMSTDIIDINAGRPLLVASSDRRDSKPVANVDYGGIDYSIPKENNGHSVAVLNIMTQLINLLKVPGSIPPSPSVLVK